ncbi:uncharacterized protein LOC143296873 [Babylonia areolata]|uniref:uncharacterized protein LOC143296873 n=1 Tax=Babylonia areolata TaxID=304850 RepID=UPI003FD46249
MLLLNGAYAVAIQICVLCATTIVEAGDSGETWSQREEKGETGEWGQWGEWSTCSAECSTGIIVRSRRCQHPHMLPVAFLLSRGDDSVHCSGSDKEIKLCNKQACGEGRKGWREEECAKYDTSVHGGQQYTWIPFIHPSDPCKLTCRAKGHHFYSNLADRVVDGTACAGATTNPSAVCLQGQCQEVGCDDVVGSPWRADACGVCKGDNSTCRKISGIFTRQDLSRGLNQIIVIPAGSTRIRVKGLRYSNNWLALQNPDGDYFLNGGQKRSAPKDFEAAGTVFTYKTKRRCAGQCLVAKGPTNQAMNLMLNTRGRNRGVMYTFNVPVNVSNTYFRRIIDSSGPRADLFRNNTAAKRRYRFRNSRQYRRHGNSSKDSDSSSVNSTTTSTSTATTTSTTAKTTTTTARTTTTAKTTTTTITSDIKSKGSSSDDDHITDAQHNADSSLLSVEENEEESDNDEENDYSDDSDYDDERPAMNAEENDVGEEVPLESADPVPTAHNSKVDVRPSQHHQHSHPVSSDHASSSLSDDDETKAEEDLTPRSHTSQAGHAEASSQSTPGSGQRMKITRKERPRFIDARAQRKESLSSRGWPSDPQSNVHGAGSDRELVQSQNDHHSRVRVGSDDVVDEEATPVVDQAEAGGVDANDAKEEEQALEESDLPSDQQSEQDPKGADPSVLPQSDSPRRQLIASFRARNRNSRHRAWRRFRRPKFSQSFKFRGRHRQSQGDKNKDDRRFRSHLSRLVQVNRAPISNRRIRYRQQPQSQVPPGGRPLSVSAYGQGTGGRTPYPASTAGTPGRQYPAHRQALRAGHSVSQGQAASENRRRPQARQDLGQVQVNSGQPQQPSDPQEEYKRQLQRRRQLIEQQIAAQNAAYQRRLEERNQRLRQQHLERQQGRHRHQNDSQASRPQVPTAPQGRDGQSLSPGRNPVASPVDGLSGGPPQPPDRSEVPTRQPETSTSPQRTSQTPPLSLNTLIGNSEAEVVGREQRPLKISNRPLIIPNRRPNLPQEGSPRSSSPPAAGIHPGSGSVVGGASAVQPDGSVRRIPTSRFTPPSSGVNSVDNSNAENVDRKWPLFISNRRQEPATPSGVLASRPTLPVPQPQPDGGLPTGRAPEDGLEPSPGHGPSQVHVPSQPPTPDAASQVVQPVQPSAPGFAPNTASLGGGFVAPQYIPENTKVYRGRPDVSAPFPSQLPSGVENPLVTGAEGNVVPNAVESGQVIGGEGNLLAIEEAEDVSFYEWRVSGLTECTLTCGGGVQQTVVVCLDTRTRAFVTDDNCVHVQRPKTKALTCNTRPCPAQWQPGQWSPCSVSCGPGEQTRLVNCLARISPTLNVTMADENCQAAEKPASTRACQNVTCNSWKVGNWSECSVRCGEGVRSRDVYCTDYTGYDVSDELCAASGSKPSQEEVCEMEPCGKGWYYTEWPQQCPARCGAGTMERHVTCLGDSGAPLPESSCNMTSEPPRQQECTAGSPCGGQWFTGEWTQCNVTCGSGHQEREVICMKGVSEGLPSMEDEDNCNQADKPPTLQSCEMEPCAAEWYMTSWTQCSRSCGTGQRTREIKCLDPQQRPSSQCPLADKPVSREACNTASCVTTPPPPPAVSECRDTFSRCQLVKHAGMCRYAFYRKKCCATCPSDT